MKLINILKEIKVRPNLGINWNNIENYYVEYLGDNTDILKYFSISKEERGRSFVWGFGKYFGINLLNNTLVLFSKKNFKVLGDYGKIDPDRISLYKNMIDQGKYKIIQ